MRHLIDLIRDLIARLRWRRDIYTDVVHVGATLEEGIGVIPDGRSVEEIAADGMTDDERRDARLAAWFAYDYDGWEVSRAQAAHACMDIRGRRAEARCERSVDRALRKFGSSLGLVAAEKLVAACHNDFAELKQKVDRPIAIDETGEWTAQDDTAFWALVEAGEAAQR